MDKGTRRRGSKLLTDRDLRATKPGDRPLYDGDCVRFLPSKSRRGRSSGQLQFTRPEDGKPDTFSLGVYPIEVSLVAARDNAQWAREQVAAGKNPNKVKREEKTKAQTAAANTFKALAAGWLKQAAREQGWSPRYAMKVTRSIALHLRELDDLPAAEIRAHHRAPIQERLQTETPGMARRVLRVLDSILDHGVEIGTLASNPLPRRKRSRGPLRHYPALVTLPELGAVLRAARDRPAREEGVNRAHALTAYAVQRIENGCGARWSEFDLDGAGTWTIGRQHMKKKDLERGPFVTPLPRGLLALLRQWRAADGERATYVCPAARNKRKPVGQNRVRAFYASLGLAGKHSPHSWRSAFSTVAREHGKDGDTIESQLDHVSGNAVQSAYDRAQRIEARRTLMEWYESVLLAATNGADVVPIRKRRG